MIVIDSYDQCSDEWFKARSFGPTASQFDRIITTIGKPSSQREKYLYQLAGERILGRKEETYQNAAMLRGIELEPEARSAYEFINGFPVEQAALIYKDERKRFSCSPDGLVNEYGFYGGLEIKCPGIPVHMEYLDKGKLPSTYFQQVQGSLFITGLEWWDFFSYYPGIKPFLIRVEPDLKWHKMLQDELDKFCDELDRLSEKLKK